MTLKIATGTAAVLALACLAQAGTLFIDFGYGFPSSPNLSNTNSANGNVWNNVYSNGTTSYPLPTAASPLALNLDDGTSSGISLVMSGVGNGNTINSGPGSTSYAGTSVSGTAASLGFVNTSGMDSLGVFSSATGTITLSGMDTNYNYTFYIFSSLLNTATNRTTLYTAMGAGTAQTATLDATGNTSNVATIINVTPNSSGNIVLTFKADSSVNTSGLGTIGAVKIVSEPIPEPASLTALTVIGIGLLWRHKK